MSAETPEKADTNLPLRQGQASFLAGILITAALLILILMVAMVGLLAYGIFSGVMNAFLGSALCLAGACVLLGLLTLEYRVSGVQKEQREAAPAFPAEVTEESGKRSNRSPVSNQESQSKRLTGAREAYARAKADLRARYKRAQNGEFSSLIEGFIICLQIQPQATYLSARCCSRLASWACWCGATR
jgi:hypothetical protein